MKNINIFLYSKNYYNLLAKEFNENRKAHLNKVIFQKALTQGQLDPNQYTP